MAELLATWTCLSVASRTLLMSLMTLLGQRKLSFLVGLDQSGGRFSPSPGWTVPIDSLHHVAEEANDDLTLVSSLKLKKRIHNVLVRVLAFIDQDEGVAISDYLAQCRLVPNEVARNLQYLGMVKRVSPSIVTVRAIDELPN